MSYYDDLDMLAKESYDKFMEYIDKHSHLLVNEKEDENGNIELGVTYYDYKNGDEDFIGKFYFNDDYDYIRGE